MVLLSLPWPPAMMKVSLKARWAAKLPTLWGRSVPGRHVSSSTVYISTDLKYVPSKPPLKKLSKPRVERRAEGTSLGRPLVGNLNYSRFPSSSNNHFFLVSSLVSHNTTTGSPSDLRHACHLNPLCPAQLVNISLIGGRPPMYLKMHAIILSS